MTQYSAIYQRFLSKITDFKLLDMSDDDVLEMLHEWMISAIANFPQCKTDLSDRSDILMLFNADLSNLEIEIISTLMMVEWLEPQLNSTLLTSQFYGSKEEKFYAQANQIDKLITLSEHNRINAQKKFRDYQYMNFSLGITNT